MKITIVGAGTAGWLVASSIKRMNPEIQVMIIHDPEIKTMGGVGETLVWNMPQYFHKVLGLHNCRDWMKESQATWKTGVRYDSFGEKGVYHDSSFAPDLPTEFLDSDWSDQSTLDYAWTKNPTDKGTLLQIWLKLHNEGKYPEIIGKSYVPILSETHWFAENERSIIDMEGNWLTNKMLGHSYHYNAEQVGKVIGKLVGIPSGVMEKHGHVQGVVVNGSNITCLKLASGEEVYSDLFIDCTGFKRQLVKHLPFEWKDADELAHNSALVRPLFYDGSGRRGRYMHGRSHFYAHSSGWSFEVPMLHRSGNGYSFNTRITPDIDKIADEFNAFLGPRNSDFNEPELRLIQWNPGYHKQFMVGNCMTMGLSWGFIDPYAANNLMASTIILQQILGNQELLKLKYGAMSIDEFRNINNNRATGLWDHIEHRVKSNFRLSPREDTHYWRTMKEYGTKNNIKQHVLDYLEQSNDDRYKKWGTKSIFHGYLLMSYRYKFALPTPKINIDERTEKLFIKYCEYKRDTMKKRAESAPPLEEFFKHWYSDDYRGK